MPCRDRLILMRHLDTNIVIAHLNGVDKARGKLKAALPDVAISSIVLAELLYGARNSNRVEENLVTHNTKHFENIEGLRLEDWLA